MTGSDPAHDFPAVCTYSRISHGWSVGTINSADMASYPLSLSHLLAPIIPGCLHYLEPTTQPPPSLTSVRTLLSLSGILASYAHAWFTFAFHGPAGSPPQKAFLSLSPLKHSYCVRTMQYKVASPPGSSQEVRIALDCSLVWRALHCLLRKYLLSECCG